jgi:hypothetical protein
MYSLRKQFSFLLLSCVTIIFPLVALSNYTNPFVPIYSFGEDISRASTKPSLIYSPVTGSEIIIPNMPAYKTQDELGECQAFSLATIIQKYTCDRWKSDIPDCKNPPPDSAISYFGMMAYTNRGVGKSNSVQPIMTNARSMYEIIKELSSSGNRLILESCKPFDQLVNSFGKGGQDGLNKRDKFFAYLKEMYGDRRGETEANIADCPECLAKINQNIGLGTDIDNLKKALTKKTYDEFLYSLFFSGCKMENFPAGFTPSAYPDGSLNVTSQDVKNKAISGLKKGKPVLFSSLCISNDLGEDCSLAHALVVSGYKRVCHPVEKNSCKDLFKVHNSWGSEWQKINNDGWVDADIFTSNVARVKKENSYRIASGSVIWLEP